MAEWIECKISDIGTVIGGATPSTKKPENYENGTISWITPKDLSTFTRRYIQRGERNITEIGLKSCSTQLLPKHAVLFSSRAPIGYVAIAANEVCTNQGFKSVVPNENIDPLFLYYLLKYNKDKIEGMGSGTTFKEVSGNTMKNIVVSVPTAKKVQERISSILGSIDDKIEVNESINNNLEQQASALYESWFENFDHTNGVCPGNWSNQMLSTIADISSGKRPPIKSEVYSQETPISIVGAASVMGFTSEANHTDKILVTGRVGTHGVIQRFTTPCWTSDNTLVIKSPFYEFTNQILHRIDYSSMNRGSTQPLITQGDMKNVVVLVPDEEILAKFEALAGSLMAQWEANNNENVKLTYLRDMLLPKLISGELDVSEIDL
ncbi:restriction endonuclease subunit S [Mogibacterium diversum]|uniref:restriction endonuclease subunit S n=1 Tax=Mogibacterium diversum TaxID=114527 RepID=UPI0026E9338D|nr:restriction endonuclease subunit S [Mogibacterium diversum]